MPSSIDWVTLVVFGGGKPALWLLDHVYLGATGSVPLITTFRPALSMLDASNFRSQSTMTALVFLLLAYFVGRLGEFLKQQSIHVCAHYSGHFADI